MAQTKHYLQQELESALLSGSLLWEFIQKHSLDGLWFWDLENPDNLWLSPEYWQLLGWDPSHKAHSREEYEKVVFQEDLANVMANLEQHYADPSVPYDQKVRFKHASGSTIWVRCRGIAIRNSKGKAIRMLGAHNDLTQEQKALDEMVAAKQEAEALLLQLNEEKRQLKHALRKLELVTEGSSDGFWHWYYNEQNKLEWSDTLYKLLGFSPKQFIPDLSYFISMLHPDDVERTKTQMEQAIEYRMTCEIEHRIKNQNGEYRWYRSRGKPYYNDADEFVEMAGSVSDIHQHKLSELELMGSKARHDLAIESVGVSLWTWHIATNENYWSANIFTLLGFNNNDIKPSFSEWDKRLHPEDKNMVLAAIENHLKMNAEYRVECRFLCSNHHYRWFKVSGKASRDENGKALTMAGYLEDVHDKKLIELELKAANQRFELATEGASVGIFDWYDINNDHAFLSNRFIELLGLTREDIDGSFAEFAEYVHPKDKPKLLAHLDDVLAGKCQLDIEYRVKHKTQGYRWFHGKGALKRRDNGEPERMVGSIQDIHKRKQLERDLSNSNSRYDLAVRGLSVGIWDWNITTDELYWSPRLKEILGIPEDTPLVNDDFEAGLHPEDKERTLAMVNGHLQQRCPYEIEYRLRHHDGHYIWVKAMGQASWNTKNEPLRMVGSVEDITARKNAELEREQLIQNLASSNEFNRAILNSSKHLLIATDTQGVVTQFNAASELALGYRAGEIVGLKTPAIWHDINEIVARARELSAELSRAIEPGFEVFTAKANVQGQDTNEWTFIDKDGMRFPVSLTVTCIRDAKGHVTGYLGVIEDITERLQKERELEAAMQKAEMANIAKSSFLASMSHEIRTPMNGILGTLQLLNDEIKESGARKLLDNALTSSYALLTIVNDILDFSKIEAGMLSIEKIDFSVRQLLDEVSSHFIPKAESKKINFRQVVDDKLHDIWCGDPVRVKQILTNLISNAVKFTEHGSITVNLSTENNAQSHNLVIKVLDTGIGMNRQAIDNLFEKFTQADSSTTRKFGGTGLGMAITKNLIDIMQGSISVHSTPGRGTAFKILLPLEHGNSVIKAQQISSTIPNLGNKNILVAEDNVINQTIIMAMLDNTGANVLIAENGLIALEKLSNFNPDIILMDIQMPELDGVEACKIIRQENQDIPIIAVTANVMLEDVQSYLNNGFNAHLAKPVEVEKLYDKLTTFLK